MTKGTLDEIFLNDESIQDWEHPVPEGSVWMKRHNASTELSRSIGVDVMHENLWEYLIVAVAAKYEAVIQKINTETGCGPNPNPSEARVLFNGNITILKNDIPGTEIEGYDVVRTGKIWTASHNTVQMKESGSLKTLILGHNPDKYRERIDAILRGYKKQEETEQYRQDFDRKLRGLTS